MKLRPYQIDFHRSVFEHLSRHRSTLGVMATGLGKTVAFAHVANDWKDGRVVVVAHRDELIRQAAGKLQAIMGETPGIEMGTERTDEGAMIGRPKVVVTSVQTMSRPGRQKRFKPDEFGLVIIDEAHHAIAKSYRDVIGYFDRAKALGVTATPKRTDELAMGQVFDSHCYDYGIEAAVNDGWLVPVHQQAVAVDGLDFSKVKTIAGDLSEAELEAILTEESMLHKIAAPVADLAGDESALVFCVSVNHARLMAEILNRYKPQSSRFLSGESSKIERREVVELFRDRKVQFLCNCSLFLEGFDAPNTSLIVMGRPTKSLPLYIQILGRGTRPLPGVVDGIDTADERKAAIAGSEKPFMRVLDFVGNSGRHKIITAMDVLGGKWALPVRQYAHETIKQEGAPVSVDEMLQRAADEMALEEALRKRREKVKAEVEYRLRTVSAFDRMQMGLAATTAMAHNHGEPATDPQVKFLRRLGVSETEARKYTKRQASAVIGKLKEAKGWN